LPSFGVEVKIDVGMDRISIKKLDKTWENSL